MEMAGPTRQGIKELIVRSLNLEDVAPDSIEDDAPLFGDGLGLDSVDALELVVAIEKEYKIKLADTDEIREAVRTVATLSDYLNRMMSASDAATG
jgi:acyl carrier protein